MDVGAFKPCVSHHGCKDMRSMTFEACCNREPVSRDAGEHYVDTHGICARQRADELLVVIHSQIKG